MVNPVALTPSLPTLGGIGNIGSITPAQSPAAGAFSGVLGMVQQTMETQQQAQSPSMAAAQGQNVPMHQVIEAVSKAELTLQTLMTVRDRAVEAYQQIQQMPI